MTCYDRLSTRRELVCTEKGFLIAVMTDMTGLQIPIKTVSVFDQQMFESLRR